MNATGVVASPGKGQWLGFDWPPAGAEGALRGPEWGSRPGLTPAGWCQQV